jgi:hypothetical protein
MTLIRGSRRFERHAQHDMTCLTPGTPIRFASTGKMSKVSQR